MVFYLKSDDQMLLDSAASGDLSMVDQALNAGAVIDAQDQDGASALILAAKHQHDPVIQLLLDKGANPNIRNHARRSALSFSISDDSIEALLDAGAQVQHPAESRQLGRVVGHKRYEVAKKLLAAGANPNEKTPYEKYTVLHQAVKSRQMELVRALLDAGVDVNVYSGNGEAAIHQAVRARDAGFVKDLLDAGADVNLGTLGGKQRPAATNNVTPLHLAVGNDDAAMIELLLDAGADPMIQSDHSNRRIRYRSPLIEAKSGTVRAMLEQAVAAQPDPWRSGAKPSPLAAERAEAEVAERVLREKYRINTEAAKARGL